MTNDPSRQVGTVHSEGMTKQDPHIGLQATMVLVALGLGLFVNRYFLTVALIWGIAVILANAKQRRERAVVAEQERILAESWATDAQRRTALLTRLAGDMRAASSD